MHHRQLGAGIVEVSGASSASAWHFVPKGHVVIFGPGQRDDNAVRFHGCSFYEP